MRVYNRHRDIIPDGAVYVGRPTKWGNPFEIDSKHSRHEVCRKYERWIRSNPMLVRAARKELRGKSLVCWCAPKECHADILMCIANEE